MVKISTSPRNGIDIAGTDLLSLGELGGRVNSKKYTKLGVLTYERAIVP